MIFTPEEIENLCRLLAGPDMDNIRLGIEMLKQHPKYVKDAIGPLMLLQNGFYGYTDEEEEIIETSKVLLTRQLKKKEQQAYQQHFAVFDTVRNDLKIRWTEFLMQLRNFEQHIDLYEKYILANPDYQYRLYHDLAWFMQRRYKKYEQAYIYIKKILDVGTEEPDIKSSFLEIVLNELLPEGKHLDEIPRLINIVHDLIPAYPYYAANYYHILGIIYDLYTLEKDKAKEYYYKTLESDENHDGALNNLANIVYKIDGDYDEALRLVKAALEIAPKDINSLDTLGCIYLYGFKNYEEAIKTFKKVLKLKKSHHYSVTALGEVYDAMGDYKQALEYYGMGLKYRPKSEYKLTKLADLYLKMEEQEEAKKVYDKILKLYPENLHAQEKLKTLM